MDDLSETLSRVLNDPEQMAKIMELAGRLGNYKQEDDRPADKPFSAAPEQIGKIISMLGCAGIDDGLLSALRPYLPQEKADKMARAIRYAKLSKIISKVLQEQHAG